VGGLRVSEPLIAQLLAELFARSPDRYRVGGVHAADMKVRGPVDVPFVARASARLERLRCLQKTDVEKKQKDRETLLHIACDFADRPTAMGESKEGTHFAALSKAIPVPRRSWTCADIKMNGRKQLLRNMLRVDGKGGPIPAVVATDCAYCLVLQQKVL